MGTWPMKAQNYRRLAGRHTAVLAGVTAFLVACAAPAPRTAAGAQKALTAMPLPTLRREDVLWIDRIGFGLDSQIVADYRRFGRERLLAQQLDARNNTLPAAIASQINTMDVSHVDPARRLADIQAGYKSINAMPDGAEKEQARKMLNDAGNKLAYEAIRRDLLRAVYSPSQLQEQMVWFWLNHFSVHQYKANLRWLIGDYEEHAIRPHALGHFKDLVLATLEHPAMLQYLDNQQNAAGHVNENYARELMELHTLGVNSGYTQQDVQQLARILTGVGINVGPVPHLKPDWQKLYLRRGAFEFNPARHDFTNKVVLGRNIAGQGFAEVEQAVTLIVRDKACARFISRELATYFIGDAPPP